MQTRNIIISVIVVILIIGGYWLLRPNVASETKTIDTYLDNTTQKENIIENNQENMINDNMENSSTIVNNMHRVTIETNKGKIVFETYDADAPNTVANFIKLAEGGFYDGVIFHRVIKGFMIQGGDPTGTGMGGPGYKFDDELNPATDSYKKGYVRGTVAMANAGPNTNGSQFFIMHQDYPLPNNYTIFGHVVEGMEVVDAIASSQTNSSDKPLEDVVMQKVTVESL